MSVEQPSKRASVETGSGNAWIVEPTTPGTPRLLAQATVWVCIAVFNRIAYTQKCLQLLNQQTHSKLRIVVVDDGSTDGTTALIKSEYPDVVLLQGNGGLYWTGAMRLAVSYVLSYGGADDYVLLLNDDLVFSQELVEKLLEVGSRTHPSLIQAVESCLKTPDLIWQGGTKINWWTAKNYALNYHRRMSEFPPDHCERSAYLTGRGVLVPLVVFRTVGNFDGRYQQSGDPEFSRRAAKAGYSLLVAYGVPVFSYSKQDNFNEATSYVLSDLWRYYFGVLSGARLSTCWRDAMLMTSSTPQGLIFFMCSFARLTVHFFRRLQLHRG